MAAKSPFPPPRVTPPPHHELAVQPGVVVLEAVRLVHRQVGPLDGRQHVAVVEHHLVGREQHVELGGRAAVGAALLRPELKLTGNLGGRREGKGKRRKGPGW